MSLFYKQNAFNYCDFFYFNQKDMELNLYFIKII